jgi:hypothetical protein
MSVVVNPRFSGGGGGGGGGEKEGKATREGKTGRVFSLPIRSGKKVPAPPELVAVPFPDGTASDVGPATTTTGEEKEKEKEKKTGGSGFFGSIKGLFRHRDNDGGVGGDGAAGAAGVGGGGSGRKRTTRTDKHLRDAKRGDVSSDDGDEDRGVMVRARGRGTMSDLGPSTSASVRRDGGSPGRSPGAKGSGRLKKGKGTLRKGSGVCGG